MNQLKTDFLCCLCSFISWIPFKQNNYHTSLEPFPAQLRDPEPEASGKVATAHTVNRMGRPRQFFIGVALYFSPKMGYSRIQSHVNHVDQVYLILFIWQFVTMLPSMKCSMPAVCSFRFAPLPAQKVRETWKPFLAPEDFSRVACTRASQIPE